MKNLATLKSLSDEMFMARGRYCNAVYQNMKELGKELTISDPNWEEDLGYPKGMLLSVPNKHNIMVDAVYDRIKMDGERLMVHVAYWDDGEEDWWQDTTDIGYDTLIDIYWGIDWADDVKQGDAEKKTTWLLTQESNVDGEIHFNVVVCADEKTAKAEMKKEIEWIKNDSFHFRNFDERGDDFEVEQSEHRFFINDDTDDYYEDIMIFEKEIESL